jgi:hypothetical protein
VTANQLSAAGNKQPLTARQIIGTQRHTLKMAAPNTGSYIHNFSLFMPLKYLNESRECLKDQTHELETLRRRRRRRLETCVEASVNFSLSEQISFC